MPPQAIASPEELERFARELKQFNARVIGGRSGGPTDRCGYRRLFLFWLARRVFGSAARFEESLSALLWSS